MLHESGGSQTFHAVFPLGERKVPGVLNLPPLKQYEWNLKVIKKSNLKKPSRFTQLF